MMHEYEIKKIGRTWYVMRDGMVDSGYTTKKYATKVIETRKRQDEGEIVNPKHPEWERLMAH